MYSAPRLFRLSSWSLRKVSDGAIDGPDDSAGASVAIGDRQFEKTQVVIVAFCFSSIPST